MKFHLVTYSDGKFKKEQDFINKIHGDSFEIHAYDSYWMIRGVLDGGFGNHM